MLCRSLHNAPDWLLALLHHKSWTGCYGSKLYLSYSFLLENKLETLFSTYKLNEYVNSHVDFTPIDSIGREWVKKSFGIWADIANIVVTEDNLQAHLLIFNFPPTLTKSVLGFSSLPVITPGVIGITTANLDPRYPMLSLLLHETGHFLGLVHPFNSPHRLERFQNYTSFSVMNYEFETDHHQRQLVPMSPMPADYEAMQFIYGINPNSGRGNNVYNVQDYLFKHLQTKKQTTIITLPWDVDGIDTLSAKHLKKNVWLNMRPHQRSEVNEAYIVMPNIEIENVVGSEAENKLILNSLPNVVDVRDSTKTSLWVLPEASGHDKVLGFQPKRDTIEVETAYGHTAKPWLITDAPSGEIQILNETIHYQYATQIIFSDEHRIILANVRPHEITNHTIKSGVALSTHGYALPTPPNHALDQAYLALSYSKELSIHFLTSASVSVLLTSCFSMLNHLLRHEHYDESVITLISMAIHHMPILFAGNYSTLAILLSLHLYYSPQDALLHSNALLAALACSDNDRSLGLASFLLKTGTAVLGGWAGTQFSLWAQKKIIGFFAEDNEQQRELPKTRSRKP